ELRRVYKPVRRAEICVIQRVEGLSPYLQRNSFRHRELPLQREIQSLSARTIDGVPSHVAKRERCWSSKRRRVEPAVGSLSIWAKNRLAGIVRPNRILTQQRSRIGSVTKNCNGER